MNYYFIYSLKSFSDSMIKRKFNYKRKINPFEYGNNIIQEKKRIMYIGNKLFTNMIKKRVFYIHKHRLRFNK